MRRNLKTYGEDVCQLMHVQSKSMLCSEGIIIAHLNFKFLHYQCCPVK